MAAATSAADRSLDLVISFSIWQTHYCCLISRRAFEPRYSGTVSHFEIREHKVTRRQIPSHRRRGNWIPGHRRTNLEAVALWHSPVSDDADAVCHSRH